MKRRLAFLVLAPLCCASALMAGAQNVEDSPSTIITEIEKGVIVVVQPEGLNSRLARASKADEPEQKDPAAASTTPAEKNVESSTTEAETAPVAGTVKTAGYRVQVFSDNNVRTAKSEARAKAQAISTRLPQYRTYVAYNSPYWRLRVGDFPTLTEAENAADEIKKIFPAYAREVRVVKDRINR